MATVGKNVLGDLRGKIGNTSARILNGKPIFASLPSSFNTPQDENSVLRRNKFSSAVKMTKLILEDELIKSVWSEKNTTKMNTYNYLMKTNYRYLNGFHVTQLNQITPITGFLFNISNFTINQNDIAVDIDPISNLENASDIYLKILFQMSDPVVEEELPFEFVMLNSNPQSFTPDTALNFSIPVTSEFSGFSNIYAVKQPLVSLIATTAEGNLAAYSSTKLHTI